MSITRRRLVGAALATVAGATGASDLLGRLARILAQSDTATAARPRSVEQHVLQGVKLIRDHGVAVLVPPLHHRVVTARLGVDESRAGLRDAREALELALSSLEADFPAGPAATVAWGLPYFRNYVPAAARRWIPVDLRATAARGREVRVLEDARRFPSDPDVTILGDDDVAVLIRGDSLPAIDEWQQRLFDALPDVFSVTSVRGGFVGGGFQGRPSLPKSMATAARVPGAELIPRTAELFLGFTSTVAHGLGPPRIANFETLGYAKLGGPYFVGGTHMHLSHLKEDVNAWYLNFDHREQVEAMFRAGLDVSASRRTVRQGPAEVQTAAQTRQEYARRRAIGHAGSIQSASRLGRDVVGPDGTRYPKGTAVPQRADFNTLDNPFAWSSRPGRDGMRDGPQAGVHFVVFNPSSDDFERVRLAMDGILPDGTRLPLEPRSRGQGINSVFHATHRQNFLVPPRAYRSFPLSERRA